MYTSKGFALGAFVLFAASMPTAAFAAGQKQSLNPQPIPPGSTKSLNPQPIPPGRLESARSNKFTAPNAGNMKPPKAQIDPPRQR